MTVLAGVTALEMPRVLARGGQSVVTAEAVACNARVIEMSVSPEAGGMTVFAEIAGLKVPR